MRFEQVERTRDDFNRGGIVAEVDFTLDALLGGGIESKVHGDSIALAKRHGNRPSAELCDTTRFAVKILG